MQLLLILTVDSRIRYYNVYIREIAAYYFEYKDWKRKFRRFDYNLCTHNKYYIIFCTDRPRMLLYYITAAAVAAQRTPTTAHTRIFTTYFYRTEFNDDVRWEK